MCNGIEPMAVVNALTTVLTQVHPNAVVSAGTTDGLGHQIEVGDVCAPAGPTFTGADITAFGYAHNQTSGRPETFAEDAVLLERLE